MDATSTWSCPHDYYEAAGCPDCADVPAWWPEAVGPDGLPEPELPELPDRWEPPAAA